MQAERIDDGGSGFIWQDYLDATETMEVPQIMFLHVELTLQSDIEVGMSLEVPISKDSDGNILYWVATVVMNCGPLLRLRYFGGEDRSLEFWFNLTREAGHELGWCVRNNKKLEPPKSVIEKSSDCLDKLPEFLLSAKSVPQEMLTGVGLSITDKIKKGMTVEVSDPQHPYKLWVATIIENVGGRLLLRYKTPGSSVKHFWKFCTSASLHDYGFSLRSDPRWFLEPPSSIVETHTYEEWKELTESAPNINNSGKLFHENVQNPRHKFQVGMKLEAITPTERARIAPATVVKVFDNVYFLVQIDDHDDLKNAKRDMELRGGLIPEKSTWLCTANHPYIFPVGWAESQGVELAEPRGWSLNGEQFDWETYLEDTESDATPADCFPERKSAIDAGYAIGMMLEAVDPEDESIICAARITKVIEDLLWIKLENYHDRPEHIVHMHSTQIFPVGWCESNHYPIKPPRDYIEVCEKFQRSMKNDEEEYAVEMMLVEPRSTSWCPVIYFNYRCFTGPMISKGKLATLPKTVGPGPVVLVMREVISMIVSVGYRTSRILKLLQCDTDPDPGFQLEVIKAKHKTSVYRANVPVITSGDMVAEFCRSICKKLLVCPNLFGPVHVPEEDCPERCNKSSKNKFLMTTTGVAKRGKPKAYENILVQKPKVLVGKRKRRRGRWANKDKDNVGTNDGEDEMPYSSLDLSKHVAEDTHDAMDDDRSLLEIDIMIQNGLDKPEKCNDLKVEVPSSNASEDSQSSFNDRKSKDSNVGSSGGSVNSKTNSHKFNNINGSATRTGKREREWETSVESDCSDPDAEYIRMQKKQRRPKTRKLESNPLFWTVDDVYRYLQKTSDCEHLAEELRKQEIDGLAFLLLNLPSLTHNMKMCVSTAMKLCRHVEQVKVTFFLRHINEVEPEQYEIV